MWLRMAGYRKYISSTYIFISSFVSLSKYAGRKLNTLMWLRMAGEFMSIYIFGYALSSQLWLRMAGYLNYLSSTYVFISSFVSLTKYAGRKLKTVMWLRMAGKFMTTYFFAYDMSNQQWLRIAEYINYLSSTYVFIFSFVSLTKYAGRKLKTVMWLRMAGKFMSTYFIAYVYLAYVSSIDCG